MASGSSLPGSYNYVRNSVKVVINAYSGKTTFYNADPSDPILQAYEAAFPHMFTPLSKMSPGLQAHLRYPPDIFSIQSAIYGRYHLTSPSQFYAASNAWQLSPTAGAGTAVAVPAGAGHLQPAGPGGSPSPARMAPLYQVTALPGFVAPQTFTVTDAYVPASQSNASGANNPNLTAFMVGTSDPGDYGKLTVYETPQGTTGPANADSYIQANQTVSKDITLLDQHGSEVLLGNTLMVPVGQSIIYLRPLYVASSSNPQPQLTDVIGVLGQKVVIEPTVSQTLSILLNTVVVTPGASSGSASATGPATGTVPAAGAAVSRGGADDYQNALAALEGGRPRDLPDRHQRHAAADHRAQAALKAATLRRPPRRPRRNNDHDDNADEEQDQPTSKAKTPTRPSPRIRRPPRRWPRRSAVATVSSAVARAWNADGDPRNERMSRWDCSTR